TCRVFGRASILASPSLERSRMTKMPPAGYPAFLQYLQSGRVRKIQSESGAGKRDRYDIDKMGSFGLWFADATNSAGRSWWNGFSRFKSRRGANAVVRESGRLPSIRAGFAGYS